MTIHYATTVRAGRQSSKGELGAETDRERRRQAFLGEDPPLGTEAWRERVRLRAKSPARMRLAATILLTACERGEIAGWRPAASELPGLERQARALQAEARTWAEELSRAA